MNEAEFRKKLELELKLLGIGIREYSFSISLDYILTITLDLPWSDYQKLVIPNTIADIAHQLKIVIEVGNFIELTAFMPQSVFDNKQI